jgi:hypothetical protein
MNFEISVQVDRKNSVSNDDVMHATSSTIGIFKIQTKEDKNQTKKKKRK